MRIVSIPAKLVAAAAAAALLTLTGCSDEDTQSAEDTMNTATEDAGNAFDDATQEIEDVFTDPGDTTCAEYMEQDPAQQRETTMDYLQQESDSDTEPGSAAVDGAAAAIMALCSTPGSEETPIRDADIAIAPMPEEPEGGN